METTRQKKIARLIQKELAQLFLRDYRDVVPDTLISINTVRASPDLGITKVYISALGKHKETALDLINVASKQIRHTLAKNIRNQVRAVPELLFFYDDTIEYSGRIDEILSGLEIPPEPEDDDK